MAKENQKDIIIYNNLLSCINIQAQSLTALCERSLVKGSDQLSRKAIKEIADYLAEIAALYEKEVPNDPQKRIRLAKKIEKISEDFRNSSTFQLLCDILGIIN